MNRTETLAKSKSKAKRQNFVAKYGLKVNKPAVHKDKKYLSKTIRGSKHKGNDDA